MPTAWRNSLPCRAITPTHDNECGDHMNFKEITVSQAQQMIAEQPLVLLDRRDAQSYRDGHVDDAMFAHDGLIETIIKKRERSKPIIVYCYKGNASKELAGLFGQFGFDSYSVIGGFTEWQKALNSSPCDGLTEPTLNWLIEQGFNGKDINQTIINLTTPLMHACRHGAFDHAEALVKGGAQLNLRNADGNTALWLACYANHVDIIRLLVEAGADLNNQNDNGATALVYAASAGRTESVRCLLEAGADPKLVTLDDFSALDIAGNREIHKLLRPYF